MLIRWVTLDVGEQVWRTDIDRVCCLLDFTQTQSQTQSSETSVTAVGVGVACSAGVDK